MNWYVVNITGGFEQKIKNTIETLEPLKGIWKKVLIPVIKKKRFYKDRLYNYTEKLYPGYVFVACEKEDHGKVFASVSDIPGILNMSSMKDTRRIESSIEEEEMVSVLQLMSDTKDNTLDINENNIFIDDRVKITDGPFSEFKGIVKDINKATHKETKVKVVTEIFDNTVTTIIIPLSQVELL